jgi:hypothetical protein
MGDKTQTIRLLDMWLVGPFMIWASGRVEGPAWARQAMFVLGVLTILYNGHNYMVTAAGRRELLIRS